MNEAFETYGNDNALPDDWTGGDGTYSVDLPDGRRVWIFSDSFLGLVNPDGSRPGNSPFINNSAVVEEAGQLIATLHGGSPGQPTSLILPTDGSTWYWPQEGVVEGDHLRVFVQGYVKTGPGAWDFEWTGTDVASFLLPSLALESVSQAPSTNQVAYGASFLQIGSYTYIFGVEDLPTVNYLHLARASGGLFGAWEYLGTTGWSPNPTDSTPLLEGVGNGLTVLPYQGRYVLVTMADSDFFGNEIVVRAACKPWGPWGPESRVYVTPELGGDLFSYNAHAHGSVSPTGHVLVSYDVNTFQPADLWGDVTIYRPRFLDATMVFQGAPS
jgi:hypothetical protein